MGRIHGNGDVCLGSNATMNFEFVTASGRILNHSRSGGTECLLAGSGGTANIRNAANTGWTALTSGNDHIGSGAGWLAAVSANWGSHAQDSSHDVPVLKVPVIGTPVTQSGRDMAGTVKSNASASRFLVDPPRVDNSAVVQDSADILAQKFACKADIRIINGIWFLKPNNPTDDCGWPGTPIWSDHPGNYTTAAGLNTVSGGIEGDALPVGQAQVHPATPRATKYSYYETDAAHEVVGNADGVISYGPVMHNGAKHVPAFTYLQNSGQSCGTPAAPCLCQRDSNNTAYGASGTVRLGNATFDYVTTPTAGQGCKRFGGATLTLAEQLVHGTRSGFNDPRVAKGETAAKGRVLPINVDVAGLAAALADTTGGELGAKFAGLGRTFNGVVYVTSGWVNAQTEYGTGTLAPLWPDQGGLIDTNQTNHYAGYGGNLTNDAIPYPLCSGNRNHTQDLTNGGVFRHHSCGAATAMGTPNAVRVINGANMVAAAFPKGLTIASNLPVYILGNYNTTSDPSSAGATPWIPALVAGDAITLLSNNWTDNDDDLPWSVGPGAFTNRTATATTYNTCVLSGWIGPTGTHNGGLHNFPRFLEDWSGVDSNINGSMVNAFYSVYARQNFPGAGTAAWAYVPPNRLWGFDPHLNSITNQPPGAPVFTVSATKRWARE